MRRQGPRRMPSRRLQIVPTTSTRKTSSRMPTKIFIVSCLVGQLGWSSAAWTPARWRRRGAAPCDYLPPAEAAREPGVRRVHVQDSQVDIADAAEAVLEPGR